MPSVLTHDFFGRDVYPDVARQMNFKTTDEMDAFLLGNQGPDPLFYLVGNPLFDKGSRVGETMHDAKPALLFWAFRKAIDELDEDKRAIAQAYLAGFVCHYLLDRTTHPLIFAQEQAVAGSGKGGVLKKLGGTIHANIEREIDEMMLFRKRGCTVETYKPFEQVLHGSKKVLGIIDALYEIAVPKVFGHPIAPNTFSMAIHLFRIANRLFFSPKGGKRLLIGGIERLVKRVPLSFYSGMSHRATRQSATRLDNHERKRWHNPFTPDSSNDSFLDLYDKAQKSVLRALKVVFGAVFTIKEAQKLTAGLNFSGKPVE